MILDIYALIFSRALYLSLHHHMIINRHQTPRNFKQIPCLSLIITLELFKLCLLQCAIQSKISGYETKACDMIVTYLNEMRNLAWTYTHTYMIIMNILNTMRESFLYLFLAISTTILLLTNTSGNAETELTDQ